MNHHLEPEEESARSGVSKVDFHGWRISDKKGEFAYVSKYLLNVDTSHYQRTAAVGRILTLAQHWSWIACGVLIVVRRRDGTLWVVDGQHRKLAADKRADIKDLPCLIFTGVALDKEAEGFLKVNTVRGPMQSHDAFRAMLVAKRPVAVAVNEIIEESGYTVSGNGTGRNVGCASVLMYEYERDRETFRSIWLLCVELSDGQPIRREPLEGLCYIENALKRSGTDHSLLHAHNIVSLRRAGMDGIKEAIAKARAFYAKGGAKVYAEGIVQLMNHKRTSRRIPSMFG